MIQTEIKIEEDIYDLVPHFLASRTGDLERLRSLYLQQKYDEMAKISHTIKGIAKPYGFPTLEQLSRELELCCKNKNSMQIGVLLDQFEKYLHTYTV